MNQLKLLILGNGKNQIRKNVIWNICGSAVFALSSIVLFMAASYATGEYYSGIFSIAYTTGQLFMTISYYEVRAFQVTDVTHQYSFQDYFSVRVITSIIMMIVSVGFVCLTKPSLLKLSIILLMCFYKMIDGVADVFESEFHRHGRLDLTGKSLTFRTFFSSLIFVIIVFVTKNIVIASVWAVIAAVIALLMFDFVLIKEFEPLRLSFNYEHIAGILKACFLLCAGSFLANYILNASKYAIDGYMTAEAVSLFTAIYMPTSVINLLSSFIFRPMLTTMGEHYAAKEWESFRILIVKLLTGVGVLTVICCIGAYLIGIPVLSFVFNCNLKPYKWALVILIFGGGCNAAAIFMNYILTTMRRQKHIFICYFLTFLVALFLAPVMVRRWEIAGGAAGYAVLLGMEMILFSLATWLEYRKAKREK